MKKINYILIIVAVLGIVFAFSIFSKEGIAINVNSKNKDLVYQSLNGKIENYIRSRVALRRINHISFFRKDRNIIYYRGNV